MIVSTVVRELFDKSSDEEVSEMLSLEYPIRATKIQEKEGGNLTPTATNNGKSNQLMKMFLLFFLQALKKATGL